MTQPTLTWTAETGAEMKPICASLGEQLFDHTSYLAYLALITSRTYRVVSPFTHCYRDMFANHKDQITSHGRSVRGDG